jgi:gamma-glutamyltranspeptidase/glutathione hydrolase
MTPDPITVFARGDRPVGHAAGSRSPVVARNGMIATSQPLASAAGLQMLQRGGNAIDAAITAAAVLAVVEPPMTGIGGDVFALVYDGKQKRLRGLNSSGRAGAKADAAALLARGLSELPESGPLLVTVPGAVAGWATLLEEYGTVPLSRALEPAIHYAREGFAVSDIIAGQWADATNHLAADDAAAAVFLPGGRAPRAGEVVRNPDLADSLQQIAGEGADAFYRGGLGAAIARHIEKRGGFITTADLAAHRADWVDPISTSYRGYELYEMPPNTQGFVAIEMLNILEGFDIAGMAHNSGDYLHHLVEAKRIAFADRTAYLADPAHVPKQRLSSLISKEYAAARRREIDPRRASSRHQPAGPVNQRGDTVYLAAADGHGNAVSFINSLFASFGSGVVVPGTGIALHNRGSGFTLQPGHPNQLAPGKRPLHTLVPAFLMKGGQPLMAFGVMGGDNQAQAHAQIVVNIVDFGMNVQEAGDAARVRHGGAVLAVESGISEQAREELRTRGHTIVDGRGAMGGYQAVMIDAASGVLTGGSDPRKDGLAIGY